MAKATWLEEGFEEDDDQENEVKASFPLNADGDTLYLKHDGPYGFIKVFSTRGPVPGILANQAWTDIISAKIAVQNYIERNISPPKLRPKGEPAKIKSAGATKAKQTQVANKQAQASSEEPNG